MCRDSPVLNFDGVSTDILDNFDGDTKRFLIKCDNNFKIMLQKFQKILTEFLKEENSDCQ